MKIPENLWLQDIKKTEYIFLAVKSIAVILLITYVFYESFLPIFFMIPIWVIYARDGLRDLCRKKEKEFRVQFSNAIQAMGAALKAGYSVENAISAARWCCVYRIYKRDAETDRCAHRRRICGSKERPDPDLSWKLQSADHVLKGWGICRYVAEISDRFGGQCLKNGPE